MVTVVISKMHYKEAPSIGHPRSAQVNDQFAKIAKVGQIAWHKRDDEDTIRSPRGFIADDPIADTCSLGRDIHAPSSHYCPKLAFFRAGHSHEIAGIQASVTLWPIASAKMV